MSAGGGAGRQSAHYRFSIIVPTYERATLLQGCLEAMGRLDYPREDFEVIVVDDGSPTPVGGAGAARFAGLDVSIVRTSNGGPGAARNAGAAVARGRFFAFTDDDCRPTPSWLRMLEARFAHYPDRMIGGRTVNGLRHNHSSIASQVILDMVYAYYNADPESPRFFASNNMAVPADVFGALGGFQEGPFRVASEDRELCDRWRHAGHKLSYAPEAVVEHVHALTVLGFCRQHFRYGRGAMRYHQIRARRRSGRITQDLAFYVRLPRLLRTALLSFTVCQAAHVVLRLALWQLCNTAGYVYERCRDLLSRPQVGKAQRPASSA